MFRTKRLAVLAFVWASHARAFMRVPSGSVQVDDLQDGEGVEEEPASEAGGSLQEPQSMDDRLRRQVLRNFHDVGYTGTVKIGGQSIQALFDSGSFEFVVFSKNCENCGGKKARLFDSNRSTTYETEGETTSSITYGSGTAYVVASHDDVAVDGLVSPKEFFWTVYDVDDNLGGLLRQNSFAAIMGVGPSSSVEAFAAFELKTVQQEVHDYTAHGGHVTGTIQNVLDEYEYNLATAKTSRTVLDNLAVREMSVCFGRESGSPGYFVWNDNASRAWPESFVEVPVVGDFYWSAKLDDIRIGALATELTEKWGHSQTMDTPSYLGCTKHHCTAILDTGTTLTAAPSDVVYSVQDILSEWERKGGGCDDLSLLPDLEFNLGGKPFHLPPESYIARFSGKDKHMEKIKDVLPHLYKAHKGRTRWVRGKGAEDDIYTYCSSLLSPTNADTQFGPLWIMGMPFFRQYYTTFQLKPQGDSLAGSSMSFALVDDKCRPQQRTDHLVETAPGISSDKHTRRKAQLHLDVSTIRPSSVLNNLHKKRVPEMTVSELNGFRQVADDEAVVPFLHV